MHHKKFNNASLAFASPTHVFNSEPFLFLFDVLFLFILLPLPKITDIMMLVFFLRVTTISVLLKLVNVETAPP